MPDELLKPEATKKEEGISWVNLRKNIAELTRDSLVMSATMVASVDVFSYLFVKELPPTDFQILVAMLGLLYGYFIYADTGTWRELRKNPKNQEKDD